MRPTKHGSHLSQKEATLYPLIEFMDLGVWRLYMHRQKSVLSSMYSHVNLAVEVSPYFARMVADIYSLAPVLSIVYVLANMSTSVKTAMSMHLTSHVLYTIERSIANRHTGDFPGNMVALVHAVLAKLLWLGFMTFLETLIGQIMPAYERRINAHYETIMMNVRFSRASQAAASKAEEVSSTAWSNFSGNFHFIMCLLSIFSEISFSVWTAIHLRDPILVAVSLFTPLRQMFLLGERETLHSSPYFIVAQNSDYKRKSAMKVVAHSQHRDEIQSPDAAKYVVDEYREHSERCMHISDADALSQYFAQTSFRSKLFTILTTEIPTIYSAFSALYNPGRISLSSIALLHQYATSLGSSIEGLGPMLETFRMNCEHLKHIYGDQEVEELECNNDKPLIDGPTDAPLKGRSIELRNVSFSYPQSSGLSLKNINLHIKPGQIIVLVGKNGSGKTTLMKMLASDSQFQPNSEPGVSLGTILHNNHPLASYKPGYLRGHTSIISQQSRALLPLTVSENIGIGCTQHMRDRAMIQVMARKSGIDLEKLDSGEPVEVAVSPTVSPNLYAGSRASIEEGGTKELFDLFMSYNRNFSGGELQRIYTARTFMRMNERLDDDRPMIDLLLLDEPLSATDAQGEKEIVHNFLQIREGRTMIFVTHKFGHLTKVADLIVCLKDGQICETGTHRELMALHGEYAELYRVQADAYVDE